MDDKKDTHPPASKRSREMTVLAHINHHFKDLLVDVEDNPYIKDNMIYFKLCRHAVLTHRMIKELTSCADIDLHLYVRDGYLYGTLGKEYNSEIGRVEKNRDKPTEWERLCDVHEDGIHEADVGAPLLSSVELNSFWSNEINHIKECKKDYKIVANENTITIFYTRNDADGPRNGHQHSSHPGAGAHKRRRIAPTATN